MTAIPPTRRLNDCAQIVRRYWGAHLYVMAVPGATPCMDWREVLLPPQAVYWGHAHLMTVLLHEWGHRMISPVSPARGALWRAAAQKAGLGEEQARLLANMAADAWVDRAYLENPDWKEVYRDGIREILEESLAPGLEVLPLVRLWEGFYRLLLAETAKADTGKALPSPAAGPALADGERRRLDRLWQILYDQAEPPEIRIQRLAGLLKDMLPEEVVIRILVSSAHSFTGQERNAGELGENELEIAVRAGLTEEDLHRVFDPETMRRLRLRTARLALYARVMPAVSHFLKARRQLSFAGHRIWRPGRPARELDLPATFQRGAQFIPGVTTLSRRLEGRGAFERQAGGAVMLLVDDSGSTGGDVLAREQEASFAVIAAARLWGDPVGCVAFGEDVTLSKAPTTKYVEVEEGLCSLQSFSGGTTLGPALKEGVRLLAPFRGGAMLVMTDAQISDPDEVAWILAHCQPAMNVVFFCFDDARSVRDNLSPLAGGRASVRAVAADRPFVEAAMEVIYGTA